MSVQVTNHKCPSCTAPLHFEGSSGRLECDHCGSTYDVSEIEALYEEKEQKAQEEEKVPASAEEDGWDMSGMSSDWGRDAAGMKVYECPSCGAELICEETTAATSCPYCGNPTVVPGQFGGILKPDHIIPFKLDKNAAMDALKKHYKGKVFLPGAFRSDNHIQEIQGIYVPFWLFDGEADADILFETTRSRTYTSGKKEITEISHYDVRRAGSLAFSRIPADASSKMPDDLMDSLEPFGYEDLKPFSTAYLPGYLADRYDVTAEDSQKRVDLRCVNTVVDMMRDTVRGYGTCIVKEQDVRLRRGKVHYALLPVWMLKTRWKEKDFIFAMNGQTGRMVGDLPMSWGRFWGLTAAIAVPLIALTALLILL